LIVDVVVEIVLRTLAGQFANHLFTSLGVGLIARCL